MALSHFVTKNAQRQGGEGGVPDFVAEAIQNAILPVEKSQDNHATTTDIAKKGDLTKGLLILAIWFFLRTR